MCTNGFVDHTMKNHAGPAINSTMHHHLIGTKGYMAGVVESGSREPNAYSFIRNQRIGDEQLPYIYVTSRRWDDDTLVLFGGPEETLRDASTYQAASGFPVELVDEFERDVMPLAYPEHRLGDPFDYQWHGLMGYTTNRLRMIGPERRNPALLYNLGCNGVGFMPSILGGRRIARIIAGEQLEPSIFDPPR
jgi:glycine/D-amino acid oxidase-like deaminating enzyme